MALLRLTTGTRDYILKSEREGFWDQKIAEAEKELSELRQKSPEKMEEIESKQEDLDELKENAKKAKEQLAKYGPTIWKLHSLPKKTIYQVRGKFKYEVKLQKKSQRLKTVGSDWLGYSNLVALELCELGLDGWSNLKAPDGTIIEFNRDYIQGLEEAILSELANEITGAIDDDDAKKS